MQFLFNQSCTPVQSDTKGLYSFFLSKDRSYRHFKDGQVVHSVSVINIRLNTVFHEINNCK